jgi:lysophospholipase L1-like esterase
MSKMSEKTFMQNIFTNKRFRSLLYSFTVLTVMTALLLMFAVCDKSSPTDIITLTKVWVGTWSTAPQLVEPGNMPPNPGLSNNTLRQIVCVSLGGDSLRVRFSNEFGTSPVTMNAVHIAISAGGSVISPETDLALAFAGDSNVTIETGTTVTSDPFHFEMEPRTRLAITIYFGDTSPDVTGHPGSRTTSYLLEGNAISSVDFSGAKRTDHWYIINGIDVVADESAAAVVTLGNSITDGKGSGTNKQNRWPDELAIRLLMNPATRQVTVLNMGIGGNEVLDGGLGPTALDRFDRDVIGQTRVRWLIILEGINDIGTSVGAENTDTVAVDLIAAYEQMIDDAHAAGIKVYGGTILPFGGCTFYYNDYREAARDTVNEWIRNSGRFDAVIDFDMVMRNPADTLHLLPAADTGDHLHPNEIGHQIMGQAVDLTLFE